MPDPARSGQRLRWRPWPCPQCNSGLSSIGVLVRSFGASSQFRADEPEKLAAAQVELLWQWVSSCPHQAEGELFLPKIAQGSEHAVFLSQDGASVYKSTLPGTFGESYYLVDERVNQRNCSPLDYLIRLRIWKKVFGSAPIALGIDESGQIFSRQSFIEGTLPDQQDVDDFLLASGLRAVRQDCFLWKKSYSNYEIWLGDARDENFVTTKLGIVPIDVRMWFSSKVSFPTD